MGQIVNLILEEFASGCVPGSDQIQHIYVSSAPPQSLRRLLHHPNRLSSMSGSVPLGSSALTFEKWQGHITTQMVYVHTQKVLGFPW